jgi:hypothetical protein
MFSEINLFNDADGSNHFHFYMKSRQVKTVCGISEREGEKE